MRAALQGLNQNGNFSLGNLEFVRNHVCPTPHDPPLNPPVPLVSPACEEGQSNMVGNVISVKTGLGHL